MRRAAISGLVYGLFVFGAGFVIGSVRVMVLVPRLGETAAVLAELPVMLTAVFLIARWAITRWNVRASFAARAKMGVTAFAVLMVCELVVSITVFGNTVGQHFARFSETVAWIGLAAQLVVVAMPLLFLAANRRACR